MLPFRWKGLPFGQAQGFPVRSGRCCEGRNDSRSLLALRALLQFLCACTATERVPQLGSRDTPLPFMETTSVLSQCSGSAWGHHEWQVRELQGDAGPTIEGLQSS